MLHRPAELFSLLKILRPELFFNFIEFSQRYCGMVTNRAPQYNRYKQHMGCSNTEELNFLMSQLMIRRLKKDVRAQLPAKIKQKIAVDVSEAAKSSIRQEMMMWKQRDRFFRGESE